MKYVVVAKSLGDGGEDDVLGTRVWSHTFNTSTAAERAALFLNDDRCTDAIIIQDPEQ